jgi:hypothetical protein
MPLRPCILLVAACLAPVACAERPRDAESVEPDDVGIEGDPAEIEGAEIGEETMDNAKAVEPGPAELEVNEPQELPGYPD